MTYEFVIHTLNYYIYHDKIASPDDFKAALLFARDCLLRLQELEQYILEAQGKVLLT